MTAEGDNRVLMIKVVKDLLSIYMKNPDFVYNGEFIKISDKNDLYNLKNLSILIQMIEKFKLDMMINPAGNHFCLVFFSIPDDGKDLILIVDIDIIRKPL